MAYCTNCGEKRTRRGCCPVCGGRRLRSVRTDGGSRNEDDDVSPGVTAGQDASREESGEGPTDSDTDRPRRDGSRGRQERRHPEAASETEYDQRPEPDNQPTNRYQQRDTDYQHAHRGQRDPNRQARHSGDGRPPAQGQQGNQPAQRGERNQPGQGQERRPQGQHPLQHRNQQQGRQHGQQPRQGQQPPRGPPGSGPNGRGGPNSPDDSSGRDLGRREFLLGGAGAAALAAGGWWFFLRGPSGAKGVADEYFTALESADWLGMEPIYHRDSQIGEAFENNGIEDYAEALGPSRADRWAAASVSIEGLYELDHIENPEEEGGPGPYSPADDVEEFKTVLAVVEVDLSNWEGLDSEEEAVQMERYRVEAARDGRGDWSLWRGLA